jgi:hypothetical protein
MAVPGKLEVIVKINALPVCETLENQWKTFEIDCDGRMMSITVRPKVWKKLTDAHANYPQWVATLSGNLGTATQNGFVLEEVKIQVFERKSKETAAEGSEPVEATAKSSSQGSAWPTVPESSLDGEFKRKSQERMQRLKALKQEKHATAPEGSVVENGTHTVLAKPSNFKVPAEVRQIAKMNIEVR